MQNLGLKGGQCRQRLHHLGKIGTMLLGGGQYGMREHCIGLDPSLLGFGAGDPVTKALRRTLTSQGSSGRDLS